MPGGVCANQITLNIDSVEIVDNRQPVKRISRNDVTRARRGAANGDVGWSGSNLGHRHANAIHTIAVTKCCRSGNICANKISLDQIVGCSRVYDLNSHARISRNDVPRSNS